MTYFGINVVSLLVIGKSINIQYVYIIHNMDITQGIDTYSKNSGRATVSPNLCALKNKVYKYGKNRYRILREFFDDCTTKSPI